MCLPWSLRLLIRRVWVGHPILEVQNLHVGLACVYIRCLNNPVLLLLRLRNLPHSLKLSLRNICVCEVDKHVVIAPSDLSVVVGMELHLCIVVCVRRVTHVLSSTSAIVLHMRWSSAHLGRYRGDCHGTVCFSV